MPCQFFALRLLALASQLESYCTYLFRFRSGPSDSVSHVVIHILAIHFPHKAALCSSVSVALHVRSNPYQINAFPSLFASTPVNSPPSQFISTRIPSSPNVSISVLLHAIPYRIVPLPFQICSFLDLAPLLLFYVLSFCYPAHCFSVPLHFCVILLLFDSLSCFFISPLLGSSHCHSIACHISSFHCLIGSFHLLAVPFRCFSTLFLCRTFYYSRRFNALSSISFLMSSGRASSSF